MHDPYFSDPNLPGRLPRFRMVSIPAGGFHMGSPDDDPDAFDSEKPRHPVRLDGFRLAETPVTQELWEAVMGANPARFKGLQRPVERVSWFHAAVFCNALSRLTGREAVYLRPDGRPFGWDGKSWTLPNKGEVRCVPESGGYRLPTEAEWEYAARGAAGTDERYAGSDLLDQVGWYAGNSGDETHDVALLLPNALGLYDMSGNVWEWCEDWWGGYTAAAQKNPRGPEKGIHRVNRGGGWGNGPRYCRPASRDRGGPGYRDYLLGFRLALSLQSDG